MIGETGWPSAGISFNNSVNNAANAQAYFEAIKQWAVQRAVMTYYFEAIDETWKSNRNAPVPPAPPPGKGRTAPKDFTESGPSTRNKIMCRNFPSRNVANVLRSALKRRVHVRCAGTHL